MRNAVVTHAWSAMPSRSSAMTRIDVPTTVWLSDERNIAPSRPTMTKVIWRLVITPPASTIAWARSLLDIRGVRVVLMGPSMRGASGPIVVVAGRNARAPIKLRGLQTYTERTDSARARIPRLSGVTDPSRRELRAAERRRPRWGRIALVAGIAAAFIG